MALSLAYEDELNKRHQELVARRTALAKSLKQQEQFDMALQALPNDHEAEKRNNNIRQFCYDVSSNHGTLSNDKNIALQRHKNLIQAYEKMVMREVALEQSSNFISPTK